MRIAIFAETFLPKWDGIANTLCYTLEHFARRGHKSLMFAPQGAPSTYAETRIIGLRSIACPFYRDLRLVPPTANVEGPLREFDPHIIHLVNPAFLGRVGLRHAAALDVPVVASYHTDLPGYTMTYGMRVLEKAIWRFFRNLHNRADLNFAPSKATMDQLAEHGFERLRIWPHGVDTDRFQPSYRSAEWRARLSGGHPDDPLLLYVGRLAVEKRLDWLRPLMDQVPRARLAIVGHGPEREHLEELFAGTSTVFTGFLSGEDLSSAYASADLFVFPSDTETFGNVVLEAMASGLPVIAPRSGGPVDHVIDGQNGFLFDPGKQQEIVALVRRLVSDPGYLDALSARALEHARGQSWEATLDGLLADYAETLLKYAETARLERVTRRRSIPLRSLIARWAQERR